MSTMFSARRFVLCLGALLAVAPGAVGSPAAEAPEPCRVTVRPERVLRSIDRKLYGVNALFWIDDDAVRADGRVTKRLRELPCGFMRFPGGTVADNYHWKTQRLDDPSLYPKTEGPQTTDTDEFIAWCREVGAEPLMVVNAQSGVIAGDLEAGLREAAEWVDYCNRQRGYRVRYWEIGNEIFLNCPRRPMTAQEYASLLSRFSQAMKRVDPAIQIGAIGPPQAKHIVLMDRLPGGERQRLLVMPLKAREEEMKRLATRTPKDRGDAWWPTLIRQAGRDFDFATVHIYPWGGTFDKFAAKPLAFAGDMAEIKQLFAQELPDRRIPLAITEWNLGRQRQTRGIGSALILAELQGNWLYGGVDMANFWSTRFPSQAFPMLLDYETHEPQPPYQVLQLFASKLGSELLACNSSSSQIYAAAGCEGKRLNLILLNKSAQSRPQEVGIALGKDATHAVATCLSADKPDAGHFRVSQPHMERKAEIWKCTLPPYSLTHVGFE